MDRNLSILPWWWVLRWVWLGEGIWVIYLTTERGLTLGQVLLFNAVYSAIVILGEVPTGMIADRFGRRVSLICGSLVVVSAFFLFGIAPGMALLLGSYALFALSDALFSGADSAMLFDSLRAARRDGEFTRWNGRLNALVAAGIAAFTLAGSLMTRWTPLAWPILLSGLLSVPSILLAWRLVEPPREGEREPSFLATGLAAVRLVRRSRALWSATLLMAVTTVAVSLMSQMLQPIVIGYGVPVWAVGLFVAGQMATAAASSWGAHAVGLLVPLRHLFWAAPVSAAVALVAGAIEVIWLFPLFMLPAVAWNLLWPHFADFVSRRAPDQQRATVISTANMVAGLSVVAITPLTGYALDRLGLLPALGGTAAALLLVAVLAYAWWWRAGDRTAAPAA